MSADSVLQREPLAFRQESFQGALAEFEFACAEVPFFRRRPSPGARPREIHSLEEWARIPLTQRADYRVHFPRNVLAAGKTLREPGTLRSQSTGAGDDRITTIVHVATLAARMRTTLAANPALRVAILDGGPARSARYAAPACADVECASPYTAMHDRVLEDRTLVLPATSDPLATPDSLIVRAADELSAYAPRWLQVDATHFAFLLRMLAARREPPGDSMPGHPVPVEAIVLSYSPATRVARRQIAGHCERAVLAEVVSMSEFGWLTAECPVGFSHINNASYFPEFLTGDGEPARPGQLAELVVTSIGDRLSPHIRYRTGDLYRVWDEPCGCGSDLPVCRQEGRLGTLLTVPGRASPIGVRDVDRAVGDCPEMDAYQVRQHHADAVRVEYIPNVKDTRAMESGLVERLRTVLGSRVRLEVSAVGYLPAGRSGRLLPCVSDLLLRRPGRAGADAGTGEAAPALSRLEATC